MANSLITLEDLTKRTGSDQAIGLVEEVFTIAPELSNIAGRVISGTTYKYTKRTGLPTVSFRKVNNGSDTVKSTYAQDIGQCFLIDAQLQADKAAVDAEAQANALAGQQNALGNILADEAAGVLRGTTITIGSQFYYGVNATSDGFNGLQSLYDTTNMELSAGGSAGSSTSAYFVWEDIQGVHFVFGNNKGVDMLPEWRVQQVLGNNSKPMTAYVNNLQGWIGLAMNNTKSVGRIKLIDDTHPLTDKLIAQMLSKFPLQMRSFNMGATRPARGGLKIFCNPRAAYLLQNSRSAASTSLTAANPLAYASLPVESNGVPIILTSSLIDTE